MLVLIVLGRALRVEDREPPFAMHGSAAATALGRAGDSDPERDAELHRGIEILSGGGTYTDDPDALNQSVGDPVVLRTGKKALRVTPTRVTAGIAECAAGPLVTVDLLVEPPFGPHGLPPDDFLLVTLDGSQATPIQACSTGFAEGASQRTLVFAAVEPDLLVFGADPTDPVAVWHLG